MSALVLIVDDEPAIRRLLRTGLAAAGYRTIEAVGGGEAVAMASRDSPDIVRLDLGLPDIDGIDVIRTKRKTSAVPIIVLSVRDYERGKVDALDLGADGYVTKPFGMAEPAPFDAIDGKPVDLIVMLLSPKNADADHLPTLAAFSRRLRDPSAAAALRVAASPATARELLAG